MRSGSAVVIGVGSTGCGSFASEDATALGARALHAALDDAGLAPDAVDALIVLRIPQYERLAQAAAVFPQLAMGLPGEGRMTAIALQVGASLIETRAARTVAIVYGNDGRSAGTRYGGKAKSEAGADAFWLAQGMTSPGAQHAMMFAEYAHRHGTDPDALAAVATTFRRNAGRNPQAVLREPLDLAAYRAAPFIAEPLRRLDYCVVADGGMAVVLGHADHRSPRGRERPPVHLRGIAVQGALATTDLPPPDFWYAPMQRAGAVCFGMAGMDHGDIDALMVYDNFTPTVLFSLEGFGYCAQGGAGAFVQQGRLAMDGDYPANPSGGHLSEGYMQGWALVVEAVRQIRGEAGGRQIPDCRTVHYMCASPMCGSVIFSSRP